MFEGSGGNIVTTFFDWLKGGKQATPGGPSPSTPTGTGSQTIGPGSPGTPGYTGPSTTSTPTGPVTVPPGTTGTDTIGADTPTGLTKAP